MKALFGNCRAQRVRHWQGPGYGRVRTLPVLPLSAGLQRWGTGAAGQTYDSRLSDYRAIGLMTQISTNEVHVLDASQGNEIESSYWMAESDIPSINTATHQGFICRVGG